MKTVELSDVVTFALSKPTAWLQVFGISGRVGSTGPVVDMLLDDDILAWTVNQMRVNAERVKVSYQIDDNNYRVVFDSPLSIELTVTGDINKDQEKAVLEARKEIKTDPELVTSLMNSVREREESDTAEDFKGLGIFVFANGRYRPAGVVVAGESAVVGAQNPVFSTNVFESVAASYTDLDSASAIAMFREREGYCTQVYSMGTVESLKGPDAYVVAANFLETLIRDDMLAVEAA